MTKDLGRFSWAAILILSAATALSATGLVADEEKTAPKRRVDVHLYGGDLTPGAPLASWYRDIGITDVWLYPLKGAFPQDQRPETQKTAEDLIREKTLKAYRDNYIRYWWFERPVPDFFYLIGKGKNGQASHIWDDSPETDALWNDVCRRIGQIYPTARDAGFTGVVYDNESYYSFAGDESGKKKPWIWGGHDDQYGKSGNYYRRGLQVGRAIHAAWPEAKVIMVYAFGYEGERWWYQGVNDGGAEVLIGPEHTYGAGPGDLGSLYYNQWWNGRKTKATCDDKRKQFPFIPDNRRVLAGLFPVDFGARKPNYRAKHFREQLESAATEDREPIHVWLWPQGAFTPESWKAVEYAEGEGAENYLRALREFSSGGGG